MVARTGAKAEKIAEEIRANGAAEEERLRAFANRAERVVRERADELRERASELRGRAREYYDEASDRFDTAQKYLIEHVQERPVATTLVAVGVGVVLGLLIAGGGRRR
jgi:ElaB/YqjD/DUF883 family membrane-anchored ribosome-binding protein